MSARTRGVGVPQGVNQPTEGFARDVMDPFDIDYGPIGEDLHELAELLAVIGADQGDADQERLGLGDGSVFAWLRQDAW